MSRYSVIVPIYNLSKYVERCLNSILKQHYSEWNAIPADDGSLDESAAICDEYAFTDYRFIIIHKKNSGVSNTRNIAMEICGGEYITFCDGDDYYKPELLEFIDGKNTESIDLITYRYQELTSSGLSGEFDNSQTNYDILEPNNKIRFIFQDMFYKQIGWSVCADFFKRSIIEEKCLKFCESCNNFAEDIGFSVKYALYACTVRQHNVALYIYDRTREGSMMDNSRDLFRLNDLNEVAFDTQKDFSDAFPADNWALFSILHFCFLDDQYKKLQWAGKIAHLPDEIRKITKSRWFRKQCHHLLSNRSMLIQLQGKSEANDSIALVHYCLHGQYIVYQMEMHIRHLLLHICGGK